MRGGIHIKSNNFKWLNRIFRLVFTLLGVGLGIFVQGVLRTIEFFMQLENVTITLAIRIGIVCLFGIIFYILSPKALKGIESFALKVEKELQDQPITDILWGTLGLIIGLIVAYLVSSPINDLGIPVISSALTILIYFVLGYIGIHLTSKKKDEMNTKIKEVGAGAFKTGKLEKGKFKGKSTPKILDTSVIIDGRIADICEIGFLEGPLIVPVFVLEELQHIADNSDALKRNRGRRGLDILKLMQERVGPEIVIFEGKYEEIEEVDSKLLQLTKDLHGKIVTNDYNLNKVADVQGIEVLNINELANAVKPVVLPGEEMEIQVVKEGKEHGQGLAYLDDGTMIVVEGGKNSIGKTICVLVTSVLQTSAGKMIFTKPKN